MCDTCNVFPVRSFLRDKKGQEPDLYFDITELLTRTHAGEIESCLWPR
jgi:hypothetical protein